MHLCQEALAIPLERLPDRVPVVSIKITMVVAGSPIPAINLGIGCFKWCIISSGMVTKSGMAYGLVEMYTEFDIGR